MPLSAAFGEGSTSDAHTIHTVAAEADETFAFPLSFAQERIWFIEQLAPGSSLYTIPYGVQLAGILDVAALQASLDALVDRHESLRTTIAMVEGQPQQIIAPAGYIPLQVIGLDHLAIESTREAEVARLVTQMGRLSFDVSRSPLLHAILVRLRADEHILLLALHHIIADGWSLGVLLRELTALYEAHRAGAPPQLPELSLQYADYAVWQRKRMHSAALEKQVTYWRRHLAGAPALLQLPTDRPRPPVQTFQGARRTVALSHALAEQLKILGRQEGATLFMTLAATMATLLHRYSRQNDLVIGSGVAGRTRPELERMIGCFFNVLPLRIDTSGNPAFRTLLSHVREVALEAYAHQEAPFERIVAELRPERNLSYTPLVQVIVHLHNFPISTLRLPGLEARALAYDLDTVKSDLVFNFFEEPDGLTCSVTYNTNLFDAATIERMLGQIETLLESVASDPAQHIDDLPLLTAAERRQVLLDWNASTVPYPLDGSLHGAVEAQVQRTPDAVAVVFGDTQLTYADLNWRAEHIAVRLRALGVGPESRVGICMERSLELVVALVATLKAGGAYVPLDPTYPAERVALMASDAGLTALATQRRVVACLPTSIIENTPTLYLDANGDIAIECAESHLGAASAPAEAAWQPEAWQAAARQAETARQPEPGRAARGENVAYVIYTSGSTGRPKGVVVAHRAIRNRLLWMQDAYPLSGADRVLQKTPASFDVSVWEFFWPLLAGATLVVARPEGHRDPAYLVELLRTQAVTTLHFVPSLLGVFLEEPDVARCAARAARGGGAGGEGAGGGALRQVFCSGEALPEAFAVRFQTRLPGVALHNLYGPTEAAVDVTAWTYQTTAAVGTVSTVPDRLSPDASAASTTHLPSVPIGRPIANTQIYLLDAYGQPVPVGVPGELYIGGVGLARGYLHQAALTAERFVPDPFGATPGGRLYRTGDLARWRPDGALVFLGRRDAQVKLRGFRIELGEIEAALRRHPAVHDAAVLLSAGQQAGSERSGGDGGVARTAMESDQLVAYVVPRTHDFDMDRVTDPPPPLDATLVLAPPTGATASISGSGTVLEQHQVTGSQETLALTHQLGSELGSALRAYLSERLPEYMVPSTIVLLAELPLLPNGKIDRSALPNPRRASASALVEQEMDAPRTVIEEVLMGMWAEVLGLERVGGTADFFELGGHSLLAVRVVAHVQDIFPVPVTLQDVLEARTVAGLAARLDVLGTEIGLSVGEVAATYLALSQLSQDEIEAQLVSTNDTVDVFGAGGRHDAS